jgi:hypothetical protein
MSGESPAALLPAARGPALLARAAPGSRRRERRLVREVQRGSTTALEELFRQEWPRAYRAAYLVVHDAAAAEDIAQEASSPPFAPSTASTAVARSAPGCTGSWSTGRST